MDVLKYGRVTITLDDDEGLRDETRYGRDRFAVTTMTEVMDDLTEKQAEAFMAYVKAEMAGHG